MANNSPTFEERLRVRLDERFHISDPELVAAILPDVNVPISFRIDPTLSDKLTELSARSGYSKSELIRMMISDRIEWALQLADEYDQSDGAA